MKAFVIRLVLATFCVSSFAAEIQVGATREVKTNSIWFQEAAKLTHWQELKKSGNSKALKSYEEHVLSERDAWQFLKPLTVKILAYDTEKNQVNVEMKTPGRMLDTTWWIDASSLAP